MTLDTKLYNNQLEPEEKFICETLAVEINKGLPEAENRIWHAHPVWFLDDNPIVGYSKLKPGSGKFKDASILYTDAEQIDTDDLQRWLEKSRNIQWDYKNVVKRKGVLERLK
jgi:hypothetical protein